MRFFKFLTLCLALAFSTGLTAQRYLAPVFNDVQISTLKVYGFNYTVLPLVQPGAHTVRQPLVMQVYSPVGDVATNRPAIIYLHTGNFFPFPQNGSCGGTLTDSTNVEIASRLARMGYVVFVADYRLGWNPFSTVELVRRFTLINGAYRGVQDVRSCIRHLRKTVAEDNNPYGIDPNKITVWGQGTGGYLSLASAYLGTYQEILTTSDPLKFTLPNPNNPAMPIPMVLEAYNGDVNGTTGPTIVDATYNAISGGAFPIGDTLCIPNTVGYSSAFNLAVNMGGALGDSTWMDAGEVPLISYHVLSDFFAPCGTDILNVPTLAGPQPVVEVSGSCDMQAQAQRLGLNDIFKTIPAGKDPMGDLAKTRNGGLDGFFSFEGTPDNSSSPWEWIAMGVAAPSAGCNFNSVTARTYIDTVMAYFAPRACVALGLNCDFTSSTNNLIKTDLGLAIQPNPAANVARIVSNDENPMLAVEIFNMNGSLVRSFRGLKTSFFEIQRADMPSGLYVVKVSFEQGVQARKLYFE